MVHGRVFQLDDTTLAKICVHARSPPKSLGRGRNAGMISVYLASSGIQPLVYGLLRLTSHFGCGHIEFAFYEEDETVVLFAIRNILRSNIDRLRCKGLFRNLKLSRNEDEIVVLQKLMRELGSGGLDVCFATPEECVDLAVTESLLNPETRDRTVVALKRKYRRIAKQVAMN